MRIRGNRVLLRPIEAGDVERLLEIGQEPQVARWWDVSRESLTEKVNAGEKHFTVLFDDQVIGLIEFWESDSSYNPHAGIDVFLTTASHGKGLGTDTVRTLARYLFEHRKHHRLVIDPAVENKPAVRCYEKVGFKSVGVMRQYSRRQDGGYEDGLLMDMLAGEITVD